MLSTCFQAQPRRSQQCLRDMHSPEGATFERPDSTVLPLFTREPQTIIVLGPKTSAHPQAVLSCVWRKEMNVDRQPLLCLSVAQIRQWSMTLGAGEGGGHLGGSRLFPSVGIVVGRVGGRHGRRGSRPHPRRICRSSCRWKDKPTLRKPGQGYLLERMCFYHPAVKFRGPAGCPLSSLPEMETGQAVLGRPRVLGGL